MFAVPTQTEIEIFDLCPICGEPAEFEDTPCRQCEREQADHECPECGGDVRFGEHGIRVAVDYYICRPEDVRADWLED